MRILLIFIFLTTSAVNVFADNYVLLDESVENPSGVSTGNWIVDRFAGNTKAGPVFYQGAAREVGGMASPRKAVETPEGVYVVAGTMYSVENVPLYLVQDGNLRLLMESQGDMSGPIGLCQGGYPVWSSYDGTLYLAGPNCLRKIVAARNGERSVEIVAGTCGTAGSTDGAALSAKLQRSRGIAAASDGTIYWLETNALRKYKSGVVSTVSLTWSGSPETETAPFWSIPEKLYDDNLSMGENDSTLYINDYYDTTYGYGVLKANLTSGTIEKIIGEPKAVFDAYWSGTEYATGKINDGPPRTAVKFSGGGAGRYSEFYNALLLDGNDNSRHRWYELGVDNVTTIFGTPIDSGVSPPATIDIMNSTGIDGQRFYKVTANIKRFVGDGGGEGIYAFISTDNSGLFRAYDTTKTDGVQNFPDTSAPSNRDGRIKAAIIKSDGTLLNTSFAVSSIASGVQTQPKVAYVSGTYLVVWAELSGNDWNVLGVRVADDGTILDTTPIQIDVKSRTQTMPDVAADDSGFMVTWSGFECKEQYPNIYASRVPLIGIIDPVYPKIIATGASPEIAWNETADTFLVVYGSGLNTFAKYEGWVMINSSAKVLPDSAAYPFFYSSRAQKSFSVSALPDSGGLPQGWTFMTDHDQNYNFFVDGIYRAFTVLPDGSYDTGMSGLNAPWMYNYQGLGIPSWFVDYEGDTPTQWPKGKSALAADTDYAIAVWGRFARSGFEMYNSDLYIGRLDKFDLVEATPVTLANSNDGERNPSIAGDGSGDLVVVYEKLLDGERQIASASIDVTTSVTVNSENILVSGSDLWRGYPDITYNSADDEYLMVWQEGFHGLSAYTYPDADIPRALHKSE